MSEERPKAAERVGTGVPGMETVLNGGLRRHSATLLRGTPGAGKTIFALHFLADGVQNGEETLYINLGEPIDYLEETARGFGLDIDSVEFLLLSPTGEQFQTESSYDLFSSAEVEGPSLVEEIRETVDDLDPDRVVVDPATEFRYLTPDDHQFRTQILSLIDFLKAQGSTVMVTSQAADSMPDDDLQFLVDAVISVRATPDRRILDVPKFRGSSTRSGPHTLAITDAGMRLWPRLDASQHERERRQETLSSGVAELDSLLSGGITTGTITFLSGPTGVGKTTTGLQFLDEAATAGHKSVLYSFEEDVQTLRNRSESIGVPISNRESEGTLRIEEVGPGELTVDEFTNHVQTDVEQDGAEIVLIDGTTGFRQALVGHGDDPMRPLVKIGRYLRNMGVTGIITNEVHQITGSFQATEQRISHLADTIIILRHVEYKGELRKVIGVLKKRTSGYEPRLRELEITDTGIRIGEPLSELRGILTGTPEWNE